MQKLVSTHKPTLTLENVRTAVRAGWFNEFGSQAGYVSPVSAEDSGRDLVSWSVYLRQTEVIDSAVLPAAD